MLKYNIYFLTYTHIKKVLQALRNSTGYKKIFSVAPTIKFN